MTQLSASSPSGVDPSRLVVGVADLAITKDANAEIITHALGSCIGITVFDPNTHVGGMLHFMLPSSRNNEARAEEAPYMFADTGIPTLFRMAYDLGAKKEDLIVCAAGGAEVIADAGHFKVGSRNRTMMRKLFWKNNVLLAADETGGTDCRTMILNLADGRVDLRSKGQRRTLWPV